MRTVFIVPIAIMAMLLNHLCEGASSRGTKSETQGCLRRNIPKTMLQELNKLTSDLIQSLPSDDIKHLKLLCKFGKSIKKSKGIKILKELVDFYQGVFRKVSVKDESQKNIQILLSRLGKEVNHCSGADQSRLPPGDRNCIKKMNETFIELKSQGVYKAIGEFHVVLEWVDSYMHQKKSRIQQKKKTKSVLM